MMRLPIRALLVAVVLAASAVMPAAAASLWEGTIGTAPVVVQWDASGNGEARYFYRRHLRDITLEVARGDGMTTAIEHVRGEYGKSTGRWRMHTPGVQQWSGEWQGDDGKRLPIRLTAIAADVPIDPGLKALQADDAFAYQRMRSLRLQATKQETRPGGFRLQWWREPRSGVTLFEVIAGYPADAQVRINAHLRQRLWQEVDDYFVCMSSPGADFNQTTTLRYLTADVVSASVFTAYDCGGAHPDFGDNPINLDARTGQPLELEEVLYVGKGRPPLYRQDHHTDAEWTVLSDYRSQVFAPWLVTALTALYPEQIKPLVADDEEGCDYSDESVWHFPSWYLTEQGVHLGPSFPRAARVCEYPDWPLLPWTEVRRHRGRVDVGPH